MRQCILGRGSENCAYNATTSNLKIKGAWTLVYTDPNHSHAVTAASGNSYAYDANGNQVPRVICGNTHTLTYAAENRLVQVSGAATASFVYDGDGKRVLAIEGGTTTVFIGNYFEWSGTPASAVRYDYAGTTRLAMRRGSGSVTWLLGDHLGSASVSYDGVNALHQGYKPWGETRFGEMGTPYQFTGQYRQASLGLDFFNARWYDPALGRFAQADTLIPEASQGTQAWDRYAFVNNNPVRYNDPTGHDVGCPSQEPSQCQPKPQIQTQYRAYHDPSSDLQIMLVLGVNAGNGQLPSGENPASSYAYVPDPATQYQTITEAKPVADPFGAFNSVVGPYAQAIAYRAAPYNVSVNVYIDAYQSVNTPATWNYVPRSATIANNSSGAYSPKSVTVGNSLTTLDGLIQPGETARYNLNNKPTQVSLGETLSIATTGKAYVLAGGDPLAGYRSSSANIIQDSLAYLFRITFSLGVVGYVR